MSVTTLGYIHNEPSVDNIVAILKECGRVNNLDDFFVTLIAMTILKRKLWIFNDNGSRRIDEKYVDQAVDYLENQAGLYM